MAAMFEVIDHDFNQIQQEIMQYIADLKVSSQNRAEEFLKNDLNLSSFLEYLSWKFPEFPAERFPGQAKMIFDDVQERFSKLLDVDKLIDETMPIRSLASVNLRFGGEDADYGAIQVSLSLGIDNKHHRNLDVYPDEWRYAIEMAIAEQYEKQQNL